MTKEELYKAFIDIHKSGGQGTPQFVADMGGVQIKQYFDEFVEEYPKSVVRSDGTTDYLRTDLKSAKLFYIKATRGLRAAHEHMLACLKLEVEDRTREGSMKFMPRISKWLNSQGWTTYQDRLLDVNANTVVSTRYGTEIE
jgi:hypothetical protein